MGVIAQLAAGFQGWENIQFSRPPAPDGKAEITGRVSDSLFDTIRTAGLGADNILIGDNDHTDLQTRQLMASPELIRSLAETGATHLCIEVPQDYDYLGQQYASGQITRADFITQMSIFIDPINRGEVTENDLLNGIADTIDNAKQYGMQVHFVDPGVVHLQVQFSRESERILDRALERYERETGKTLTVNSSFQDVQDFMTHVMQPGNLSEAERAQLLRDFVLSRTNDEQLYNNIQAATNGEKTAIMYGAGHDNLAARLGGSLLVVDLYRDPGNYNNLHTREIPGFDAAGEPDIVHVVSTGQTFVTDSADPHMTAGLNTQPAQGPLPDPLSFPTSEPPAVARDISDPVPSAPPSPGRWPT